MLSEMISETGSEPVPGFHGVMWLAQHALSL